MYTDRGQPVRVRLRGATGPSETWLPLYGASFGEAISRFYKNYGTFSGRASRSEFWFVVLYSSLLQWTFVLGGILLAAASVNAEVGLEGSQQLYDDGSWYYEETVPTDTSELLSALSDACGVIWGLWMLIHIIPTLAVGSRRLHDANMSGALLLLMFAPFGSLVLFILNAMPSRYLGQNYDPTGYYHTAPYPGNYGQYPPGGYGQPDQYQQPGYGQPNQYGQQPPQY
ncbi:MAG: DUF805 domain-containing protein [Galactobacter sp.]